MSKFSVILQKLREKEDLTQVQLAKKVGLSSSAIAMYEAGERKPSIEILPTFADYFGVTTDYLLGRDLDKLLEDTVIKWKGRVMQGKKREKALELLKIIFEDEE